MNESVFGGGDRGELLQIILGDGEGDVVVMDEVFEVAERVKAVLERVGSGFCLAESGSGASRTSRVVTVGGELRIGELIFHVGSLAFLC